MALADSMSNDATELAAAISRTVNELNKTVTVSGTQLVEQIDAAQQSIQRQRARHVEIFDTRTAARLAEVDQV